MIIATVQHLSKRDWKGLAIAFPWIVENTLKTMAHTEAIGFQHGPFSMAQATAHTGKTMTHAEGFSTPHPPA